MYCGFQKATALIYLIDVIYVADNGMSHPTSGVYHLISICGLQLESDFFQSDIGTTIVKLHSIHAIHVEYVKFMINIPFGRYITFCTLIICVFI